jgi:hypothetical protein
MIALYFILGVLAFLLDIWALNRLLESSARTGVKVAWVFGILLFPIAGFVVWFIAGPKGRAVFI